MTSSGLRFCMQQRDPSLPPPLPVAPVKWRWWIHLLILASYVLIPWLIGLFGSQMPEGPVLSPQVGPLLTIVFLQLGIFFIFFGVAWLVSKASLDALLLRWRSGFWPILYGFLGSMALRIAIAILVMIVAIPYMRITQDTNALKNLRPNLDHLMDQRALVESPAYLIINMSLVSFVLAGFREELWRAGMLAALAKIFPRQFSNRKGQVVAVSIVAVVFGLAHFPQGVGGVVLTGLLGVGLGLIMVWRQSIWEAVFAHGFFDASTFAMLFLLTRYAPKLLEGQ